MRIWFYDQRQTETFHFQKVDMNHLYDNKSLHPSLDMLIDWLCVTGFDWACHSLVVDYVVPTVCGIGKKGALGEGSSYCKYVRFCTFGLWRAISKTRIRAEFLVSLIRESGVPYFGKYWIGMRIPLQFVIDEKRKI
jgi:hypothetical protein